MNNESVSNFLFQNGKYFPKNKLNEIGRKLEVYSGVNYSINSGYVSTVKAIIFTWLFTPFDRLILGDYFWGTIKFFFAVFSIYSLFSDGSHLAGIPYPFEKGYEINPESLKYLLFLILILWQVMDIVTVYWRVKKTNYKRLMRLIGNPYQSNFASVKNDVVKTDDLIEEKSDIKVWLKENPNCSLNDYYSQKK